MRRTRPGWVLRGEDEMVNEVERLAAHRLGKEAAVWTPTCGVANLAALMTLGQRNTYAVAEAEAHILTSEGMGLSVVGGLVPLPLHAEGGRLEPDVLEGIFHKTSTLVEGPRISMVCLENTHTRAGGTILSPALTAQLATLAHRNGAAVHLDGARLFNAAVALGVDASELAAPADTVAISLNKGLSAPFGALLCGNIEAIASARLRLRQLGAASFHKAGFAAAAGIVALEQMIGRLLDDNQRAADLAARVEGRAGLRLEPARIETNIVLIDVSATGHSAGEFLRSLRKMGVLALERDERRIRLVTHRSIGDAHVARAATALISVATQLG
jgi:threonine aldolase